MTRARAQASGLVRAAGRPRRHRGRAAGHRHRGPADGGAALAAAADRAVDGAYQWVVLTSSNAVSRLLDALGGRAVPASTRWAAVGRSTARTLDDARIAPDLVPDGVGVGGAGRGVPGGDPPGRLPAGGPGGHRPVPAGREGARRVVAGLTAKGWRVDEAVAYRTMAGDLDPDAVAAARRADAMAFTSSSTVERTVDLLGPDGVPPVVVLHRPGDLEAVRAAGLEVAAEASAHTLDGLVAAVVARSARAARRTWRAPDQRAAAAVSEPRPDGDQQQRQAPRQSLANGDRRSAAVGWGPCRLLRQPADDQGRIPGPPPAPPAAAPGAATAGGRDPT